MRSRRRYAVAVAVGIVVGVACSVVACGGPTVEKVVTPEHCTARTDKGEISLSPEQAKVATTIVAVAIRRELPLRAVIIALATAEQESKMRNLDYGDRDSVGVFQQRPSQGWGTAEQLQDPAYATKRFYAALVKVPGYQNMPLHEAAQRVQRSAYGPAYADHELMATVIGTALTGRNGNNGFTCLLRPKPADTGADAVRAAVRHDWGKRTVKPAENGFTVRMGRSAPRRHATAMSFWVVARADEFGLDSVRQAGKRWQSDDDADTWHEAKERHPATRITARLLPSTSPPQD